MHYGVTVPNFGDYFDPRTLADIAREAEAAEWDGFDQGLGDGGRRRFDWYFNGDTPIRHYADAAKQGVPVPPFKLSSSSAQVFEELVQSGRAVVSGKRTYDITNGWGGHGPLPGLPLFTHLRYRVVK